MSAEAQGQEAARLRALAARFFDAIEAGDIDTVTAIYHPDVVIWHNTDDLEESRETNLDVLRGFIGRAPERTYADRRVEVIPDGFVHQHLLKARRRDGRELGLHACVICKVDGERIIELREYFDTAPLQGWFDPF